MKVLPRLHTNDSLTRPLAAKALSQPLMPYLLLPTVLPGGGGDTPIYVMHEKPVDFLPHMPF